MSEAGFSFSGSWATGRETKVMGFLKNPNTIFRKKDKAASLGTYVFLLIVIVLMLGTMLLVTGYISMKSVTQYWFFYAPVTEAIIAVVVPFVIIALIYYAFKNVGKGM